MDLGRCDSGIGSKTRTEDVLDFSSRVLGPNGASGAERISRRDRRVGVSSRVFV